VAGEGLQDVFLADDVGVLGFHVEQVRLMRSRVTVADGVGDDDGDEAAITRRGTSGRRVPTRMSTSRELAKMAALVRPSNRDTAATRRARNTNGRRNIRYG
jgi:hypothetical protein